MSSPSKEERKGGRKEGGKERQDGTREGAIHLCSVDSYIDSDEGLVKAEG
jgi:hypothetical protein